MMVTGTDCGSASAAMPKSTGFVINCARSFDLAMPRTATIRRSTTETKIELTLDLEGSGRATVATGVGFFDHMLTHVARHGLFDLIVNAEGDLHIDAHHTVEDVGICL